MATRTPKIPDQVLSRVPGKALYRMASAGAEIEIGGDHPTLVLPEVRSSKWGGECWLNVRHADAELMLSNDRDKVRTEEGKPVLELPVSAAKRRHEIREGSLKWDIVYEDASALPADGIERFQLEFPDGLTWHYQPALTPEDIAEGVERPDNVVGSYAGYFHKSGRFLDPQGNEIANYETGKFAHIYRPEMVDAAGNRAWAVQELVGNELRVTLPAEWMATAVYPVTLDPTFGYTSIGGSNSTNVDRIRGNPHAPPTSGEIQSITCAFANAEGGREAALGVYFDADKSLLGQTSAQSFIGTGAHWQTFSLSLPVIQGVLYGLCCFVGPASGQPYMRFDSGASGAYFATSVGGYPIFPDPYPGGTASVFYSIYATYEEIAGLQPPTLTSPANAATGVILRPEFTWT